MPKRDERAILIIASSERDANLYYATRFRAPDDFVFLQIRDKKYLLMSDLEVDRARAEARVDRVFSISRLKAQFQKKYDKRPRFLDLIEEFLKEHRIKKLLVPGNFPIQYADPLRKRGFAIQFRGEPFFEQRLIKSPEEIDAIQKAIRHTESAVGEAIAVLKKSVIRKGKLYFRGKVLTSEAIKKIIHLKLMEAGYAAARSIVASGRQSIDPHNEGSGPLHAHLPIIIDIFPRGSESGYFADFTRTVVRGQASTKLKKMYAAVKQAQTIAFKTIRAGIDASKIHGAIHKKFEALGFKTGLINGRMQGFFHSTGHGLGLETHEPPRISALPEILKAGEVVTVEPGLYYEGTGGVRLEDVVVVTKTGCKNLTRFSKVLEI